jgi:hypothetical protein
MSDLKSLTRDQKYAFVKKHYDEISTRAIADQLGVPHGTIITWRRAIRAETGREPAPPVTHSRNNRVSANAPSATKKAEKPPRPEYRPRRTLDCNALAFGTPPVPSPDNSAAFEAWLVGPDWEQRFEQLLKDKYPHPDIFFLAQIAKERGVGIFKAEATITA